MGEDAILPVKYQSRKKNIHYPYFKALNGQKETGIPIVKLGKNQAVHVRCHALKGYGKMHAKWNPTNIAAFQHEPEITIDQAMGQTLSMVEKKEIVDSCPTRVLDIN